MQKKLLANSNGANVENVVEYRDGNNKKYAYHKFVYGRCDKLGCDEEAKCFCPGCKVVTYCSENHANFNARYHPDEFCKIIKFCNSLKCPITGTYMDIPVKYVPNKQSSKSCGHVYERNAIYSYIGKNNGTAICPQSDCTCVLTRKKQNGKFVLCNDIKQITVTMFYELEMIRSHVHSESKSKLLLVRDLPFLKYMANDILEFTCKVKYIGNHSKLINNDETIINLNYSPNITIHEILLKYYKKHKLSASEIEKGYDDKLVEYGLINYLADNREDDSFVINNYFKCIYKLEELKLDENIKNICLYDGDTLFLYFVQDDWCNEIYNKNNEHIRNSELCDRKTERYDELLQACENREHLQNVDNFYMYGSELGMRARMVNLSIIENQALEEEYKMLINKDKTQRKSKSSLEQNKLYLSPQNIVLSNKEGKQVKNKTKKTANKDAQQLSSEIDSLETQIKKLTKQIRILNNKNRQFANASNENSQKAKKLLLENESLNAKVKDLNKKLSKNASKKKLKQLSSTNESLTKQILELESKNKILADSSNKKLKELSTENEYLNKQLVKLNKLADLNNSIPVIDALKQKSKQSVSDIEFLKKQISELKNKNRLSENIANIANKRSKELSSSNERFKKQIIELKNKVEMLNIGFNKKLQALLSENMFLKSRINESTNNNNIAEWGKKLLSENKELLQKEIQVLNHKQDLTLVDDPKQLMSKIEMLKKTVKNLENLNKNLSEHIDRLIFNNSLEANKVKNLRKLLSEGIALRDDSYSDAIKIINATQGYQKKAEDSCTILKSSQKQLKSQYEMLHFKHETLLKQYEEIKAKYKILKKEYETLELSQKHQLLSNVSTEYTSTNSLILHEVNRSNKKINNNYANPFSTLNASNSSNQDEALDYLHTSLLSDILKK